MSYIGPFSLKERNLQSQLGFTNCEMFNHARTAETAEQIRVLMTQFFSTTTPF